MRRLLIAGVDVARINFSHADFSVVPKIVRNLRDAAKRLDRPLAILGDLPGPKLRVGELGDDGIVLEPGQRVELLPGRHSVRGGRADAIPIPWRGVSGSVKAGDLVFLDDGLIRLRVVSRGRGGVWCEILDGGRLLSRKGMVLPGPLKMPTIGPRDREAIRVAAGTGMDMIAVSFVRSAGDVAQARRTAREAGASLPIFAKLERPEAIHRLDEIIDEADGVMVARGDLGVSMPIEQVPLLQKRIIAAANSCGKPCITATQMLESMTVSPLPTRAEVSDVANAIIDGTDAVMLSAETATGHHPVKAVGIMDTVAREVEAGMGPAGPDCRQRVSSPAAAVGHAACQAALDVGAAWIVAFTRSGASARLISSLRPKTPICALTDEQAVRNSLAIHWGVTPLLIGRIVRLDDVPRVASEALKRGRLARNGDSIVLVYGRTLGRPGTTDTMVIQRVG